MKIVLFSKADQGKFNEFVENHPLGSIHQTYQWGEFQAKVPGKEKFWALGVKDQSGTLRATALLVKQKLPLGKCWLYCPRGPLVEFYTKVSDTLLEGIKQIAKKEKAIFLRIDPEINLPEIDNKFNLFPGFRLAYANYQPENTLKLELKLSEEDLLKRMKPKGRYNIKLAQKKGIEICDSENTKTLNKLVDNFYELLKQTTQRDQFSSHNKNYYQQMIETLQSDQMIKLYIAKYEGKVIAGIIITFYHNTAIYYYGASSNAHRNIMAPYLLQWTAIKEAKERNMEWYDFLGIAPVNATQDHPWQGVSDFKKKFGGQICTYSPAQEYIFKKLWYQLMLLIKKIKK